jgi:hypothetical protein
MIRSAAARGRVSMLTMATMLTMPDSENPNSSNFAPRSQHEARALASMVVASLPFPPLPVVVLQGEDGADGMASSFDLLQTAVMNSVMNSQLGLRPGGKDAEALARSKQATLERLQRDMAALYVEADGQASQNSANSPDDRAWVQRAYDIFCAAFRSFLLDHYAISSRDLRFYPADAVAADSVLVQQGTSHWRASRLLAGDAGAAGEESGAGEDEAAACPASPPWLRKGCSGARFSSYKQMVRAYALDLATLSD